MQGPVRQKSAGLYRPEFEHDACGMGFVAHLDGLATRAIVEDGLIILERLVHRGGTGAEPDTGDGAGILLAMPDRFIRETCAEAGVSLPPAGEYAVIQLFLPREDTGKQQSMMQKTREIIAELGFTLLLEREVPISFHDCGPAARRAMPFFWQIVIGGRGSVPVEGGLEHALYVLRRTLETRIRFADGGEEYYISSLSSRTLVYKGMLHAWQLRKFFPDLADSRMESAIAVVHSRFSTNTFPSWDRAQPCRYIAHNGEINTLRGNENWFHARETVMDGGVFKACRDVVIPVIDPGGSDSIKFDNCLEFLTLSGRPMPQVLLTMIPEAWSKAADVSPRMKAFYEYSACMMEPWDGPAAICFSDGRWAGAILDRNGLRPARYTVTRDRRVILASEAGVLDTPASMAVRKGKLGPGEMLLVDTEEGRIYNDHQVKELYAGSVPYGDWLGRHRLLQSDLPPAGEGSAPLEGKALDEAMKAFGYTYEAVQKMIGPMAAAGSEPIGAMGMDVPLAVLSDKHQPLYHYFKQLFAQVTNPPIDALREEIVFGTELFVGASGNFTEDLPENCRKLRLEEPVIGRDLLSRLSALDRPGFVARTLPMLFDTREPDGLKAALGALFAQAEEAIAQGVTLLILSDRGFDRDHAGIPALLAVSGLHHHLIRRGLRGRADIIVDSAEPYAPHHFACLVGYGASAIHPWAACDVVRDMVGRGYTGAVTDPDKAVKNYIHACVHGIVKIMSKMGISAMAGYQGAQVFEALGLGRELVDRYFTGTVTRIGGLDLIDIAQETVTRHRTAYGRRAADPLPSGGVFQFKRDGEAHRYNPRTIHLFQQAVWNNDYRKFKEYSALISGDESTLTTLRGLLEIAPRGEGIPLSEVEPVERIVQRFKTGAMSYGSISQEAHECLAIAMNRLKGKSNSGEGGEDAERFQPMDDGDSRCSAIKQVASGRFGVTAEYLGSAIEIQIKMAQGAKPGEGGHLPGHKVYPWVARVRHSTPGVGLISPPPHHDIYSIEDLAQLIYDLKNANPSARINVKLVSEAGVGTIAAGVVKGGADVVLISGYDGGTGASPRTSIEHAGLPWELGVAETHQTLAMNGLRDRVILETDGKMMSGYDVAVAALLGAEEYGFATLPLVSLGCVMMRVCNLNTCPVGVATQDPRLRARFAGKPEYVENCMRFIAMELREIMAQLGFGTLQEMIGHTELLRQKAEAPHKKAATVDLSALLCFQEPITRKHLAPKAGRHEWDHYFAVVEAMTETHHPVVINMPIQNVERTTGTRMGCWLAKRYGDHGLPKDMITYRFHGTAGQSFGAFIPQGITLELVGDANDYLCKGMCGGRVVVRPPEDAAYVAEDNIIIGNVSCYGATSGELYVRGLAGERFCVRNSGVQAVVEGLGDHGCEYMTGGLVAVLGPVGYNFAAGMSGGIAYVYDKNGDFTDHCNTQMVTLFPVESSEDGDELRRLIENHARYTGSPVAQRILDRWDEEIRKFVQVFPNDYREMLAEIKKAESEGLTGIEKLTVAFERKVAVGGNE